MTFNLNIDTANLSLAISQFGQTAREITQVARRLSDVLPVRFRAFKQKYGHQHPPAQAERLALADHEYIQHIEELATINAQARAARIQYETHLMLFEARRTIRGLLIAQQKAQRSRIAPLNRP